VKYYTWKLKWEVNPATGQEEGTDPTFTVNSDTVRIDPAFATGDLQDPATLIYCYLTKGSITPSALTGWSVTETTADAMLAAAQELDVNATLEDGFIKFPLVEVAP
jgi:hypothetical protein